MDRFARFASKAYLGEDSLFERRYKVDVSLE